MFIACWRTCTALFVDTQWKPCYTVIILRIIFIIFPFHKKRFMEWSSCFERSWGSTNAAHREKAELFGRILNCNLFRQWFALWLLCASPYNVLLLFVLPQKGCCYSQWEFTKLGACLIYTTWKTEDKAGAFPPLNVITSRSLPQRPLGSPDEQHCLLHRLRNRLLQRSCSDRALIARLLRPTMSMVSRCKWTLEARARQSRTQLWPPGNGVVTWPNSRQALGCLPAWRGLGIHLRWRHAQQALSSKWYWSSTHHLIITHKIVRLVNESADKQRITM